MSQQIQAITQTPQVNAIQENVLQRTAITPIHTPTLQRCSSGVECAECRQKRLQRESTLQRSAIDPTPTNAVPPIVHSVLNSPDQPLGASTRAFMEPRFGHDFSQIPTYTSAARVIQTKLAINTPGDVYEREADHVAEQVMRMPDPQTSQPDNVGRVRNSLVRKQTSTPAAQATTHTSSAPPIVHDVLNSGRGQPLDATTRAFMEPRFGHDFSRVRVHTDEQTAESARAVNARAYTVGHDVVFGIGQYVPGTDEGRRLLAHELAHTLQQQSVPQIQRKLSINPNLPSEAPPTDPSASLTPTRRFDMMNTLIQGLCPQFKVDSSGQVVPTSAHSLSRATLAAGSHSTGCCCLSILTDPITTPWTIEVSSVIGAQTNRPKVFLNPTNASIELGSFTAANTLAFQGKAPAAGHELCGHAALEEVHAHPLGGSRLTTDVHDPTVRIENQISQEQGVPASELRGLASSGLHRGESVDKITIEKFPFNDVNVPGSQQSKIRLAAQYILKNDEFVSIIGHSDNRGSSAAKQAVSEGRAMNVKNALIDAGVLPTPSRFTSVVGVSDSQPPHPPLDADQANWRRVEILMSGFPAGAMAPPAGTPTTVAPHTQDPNVPTLKTSSDPCIKKLVTEAYP